MAFSKILKRRREFSLLTQNSKADISNGQDFLSLYELVGKIILYILFISISSQCAYLLHIQQHVKYVLRTQNIV